MKFFKSIFMIIALLGASVSAQATLIDFDDIATGDNVDDFYSSIGVEFEPSDWLVISNYGETSAPNFAVSIESVSYVNFLDGIITGVNFSYGAFQDVTISLFDGLNGSGNLLSSSILTTNDPNNFDFTNISFTGTAYSLVVTSSPSTFGWDDLTFTDANTTTVPAPATGLMFLLGLATLAFRRRS